MAEKSPPVSGDDSELADLLDNAIQDFDKPTVPEKDGAQEPNAQGLWDEEFLKSEEFEQRMKAIFGQGAENSEGVLSSDEFIKMAEEANKILTESHEDPEVNAAIAQALKSLSSNAEKLMTEDGAGSPEALASMFSGLGLDDEAGPESMMTAMQKMMRTFLSKDVLYPSMKEITEKYPAWLESHKDSLPKSTYDSYSEQFTLMGQVCKEFEKENDTDSETVKNERFSKILALMEKMQKLGHPPKELIGEDSPFPFDETGGLNQLPGVDPSQCSLM